VLQKREYMMPRRFSHDPSSEIAEVSAGETPSLAPEAPASGLQGASLIRATHQPFLDFVRYLQGDRGAIAGNSVALARHKAEIALLQTDRVLALLCRMEAIADHRAGQ
jgi:hypothetical protein